MRLLEAVAVRENGAPAKQLARDAGLALPTAYHLLRTLTHEGYLRRDKGLFFLGEAAERLSSSSVKQKRRTTMREALDHWPDALEASGTPVYCAVYSEGEIDVLPVVDTPGRPAAGEWSGSAGGHAHAVEQSLLHRLCEEARLDRLDRRPVRSITSDTERDDQMSPRRPDGDVENEPVAERQEYPLGTVCAAIPVVVGATAATLALSVPLHQADRLLPAVRKLQDEVGRLTGTLALSISI